MPTPRISYLDDISLKLRLLRGESVLRETSLTPLVLDHGHYSSRLQIAAPIAGWGQLARLPNEIIYMILEQCTIETLLNIMLVNRGAFDFVLRLPGFDRILATSLIHIKAIKSVPSALDNFFAVMKDRTYAFLNVLTMARPCRFCGRDLVNIPAGPIPRAIIICARCCTELGRVRIIDSDTYRRAMASLDSMPPIRARL
ncbi:hypothetical protein F4680DRAFT_470803 [Xylaria scruposa]|nr:hypothetical protein F4680DRAFT_470803 [Xylaria scruposa]